MSSKPEKVGALDLFEVEKYFQECLSEVRISIASLESAVPVLVRAHRSGALRNPGLQNSLCREKGTPRGGQRKKKG